MAQSTHTFSKWYSHHCTHVTLIESSIKVMDAKISGKSCPPQQHTCYLSPCVVVRRSGGWVEHSDWTIKTTIEVPVQ